MRQFNVLIHYLDFSSILNLLFICWCGAMATHLTCNQRIVGSNPTTSSILFLYCGIVQRLGLSSYTRAILGSNPSSTTNRRKQRIIMQRFIKPRIEWRISPPLSSLYRSVAQFGSVLGLEPKGRKFKSCCSDQRVCSKAHRTTLKWQSGKTDIYIQVYNGLHPFLGNLKERTNLD